MCLFLFFTLSLSSKWSVSLVLGAFRDSGGEEVCCRAERRADPPAEPAAVRAVQVTSW